MNKATEPAVGITIKHCVGNLVKYERDNEGLRDKLAQPYRPKWINAKFRLPSGKPKIERFSEGTTDEEILSAISKKYSNYKFFIAQLDKTDK